MADDPKFSKEVENKNPRSLDEFQKDPQSKASDQFKKAKAAQGQSQEKAAQERQESEQVKKQQHGLKDGPNPPGNAKTQMKNQEHNKDLSDEKLDRLKKINDSANKNKENQPEPEPNKER